MYILSIMEGVETYAIGAVCPLSPGFPLRLILIAIPTRLYLRHSRIFQCYRVCFTRLLTKDRWSLSTASSARRAIVYDRALYTKDTRFGSVRSAVTQIRIRCHIVDLTVLFLST